MVQSNTMPSKSGGDSSENEPDGPRALLTDRERAIVSGHADDVADEYRYQTISRVRRRFKRLKNDMEAFESHGDLDDEVRSIVCGDEDLDRGPREAGEKSESKTLSSILWGALKNAPTTGVFGVGQSRPTRMTIHTENNSFKGTIQMEEKGGKVVVGIREDDGREYVIPYESIEYFEEAAQESEN